MNLTPWRSKQHEVEPVESSPLVALRREMDRLFDAFVREPFNALDWPWTGPGKFLPTIDVAENDQEVVVRAELPGIDPADLDVSVTGNRLVLGGEKKESSEHQGKSVYQSESRFGSFRRTVQLPNGVDCQNVDAQYVNGVLTIRLKKSQPVAAKRVEVKVKGDG